MIVLPPDKYHEVDLDQVPFDTYFAKAVLVGHLTGKVYTNSIERPTTFYILHPYGLSLLVGDPNEEFEQHLIEYMFGKRTTHSSYEWMQVHPDHWNNRIKTLLGSRLVPPQEPYDRRNIELHHRVNFSFHEDRFREYIRNKKRPLPAGFRIVDIGSDLFDSIEGTVIPKSFWDNSGDFLRRGIGFCIIKDEDIVAWSYTAWVHGDLIEIGIETDARYRNRGFAELVSIRFIEHCLDNDLTPVWSCRLENTGSYNLALKLGFEEIRRMPFYKLSLNEKI
ncbi:MAG: GNAT family N-acetyltransferase [Candidatus Thermoplasmatota archaeon]|nr:GNAT family N-acetyltransferase [Candidatus Thermoplasmatota archaeon]